MPSLMPSPIRTLKPVDEYSESAFDHASKGFSLGALEALISDCRNQPDWRYRSDKASAYYDMNKQIDSETERKIRVEMGIDPRQTNLIHGVVNGVLGQEAKARSDVRVEADDDEVQDVADVLSMRMKEAQRESNSDMAISNGYAGQVKAGIGWVEVSRASDPLDYPYRVNDIHRKEIWYDWRARHLGLQDGRWMVRKRWEDLDEAIAQMPKFKDVLKSAMNGWNLLTIQEDSHSELFRSYNNERRSSISRDEWCDSSRKRIKFYEVWYRVPAEVVVLHLGPTRRVMYDPTNPLHVEAVSRGRVKVSKSITRQIRMALFAGPHRLMDVATTRRTFPYVPFFAFRDDEDRSPYGLIEGMISPQDEYNERRQMINWMLKARQVYIDNDALDTSYNTIEDIARNAMKPDMVAVMSSSRKNANGLNIRNDLSLQKEQIDVMQDAKQLIQDVPRVYSTQLGNAPSGVTSGIAINSLTEAGAVAMGELNDNYRYSRKLVHEQMLELIIEDHLDEELKVVMGSGQSRRTVVLNSYTPDGAPLNRVKDAPIKVGLSDVPSSPAFRMQEQQQLETMIRALQGNPAALNILTPAFIEGSSLNNRQAVADDLRRATGVAVTGDRQAQAQQQQAQAAQQQAKAQLDQQMAQARIDLTKAQVLATETTAGLNVAKSHQIGGNMVLDVHLAEQSLLPAPDPQAMQSQPGAAPPLGTPPGLSMPSNQPQGMPPAAPPMSDDQHIQAAMAEAMQPQATSQAAPQMRPA